MKCVAKAIFHNRYMITVPNSACMSVGELKTFGMMEPLKELTTKRTKENNSNINMKPMIQVSFVSMSAL